MNVDLNISNYSLVELLKLFHLPVDFDEQHLKRAKKQVLMMHPDKSKLDKEFFLFFSSAYRLLFSVYTVRNRSNQDTTTHSVYTSNDVDLEDGDVWNKLSKRTDGNELFNAMFEKHVRDHMQKGHGEWLKSQEETVCVNTRDEMNRYILKKKTDLSILSTYNKVMDTENHSGTMLDDSENFQSQLFSSLQYDDVKHAYTESVVPVTEEFIQKEQSSDLHALRNLRDFEIKDAFERSNHVNAMKKRETDEIEKDASRAYFLAKQDEDMKMLRKKMTSNLLRLNN
jgi:hypothetical protein